MTEHLAQAPAGLTAILADQNRKKPEADRIHRKIHIREFLLEAALPAMKYRSSYPLNLKEAKEAADKGGNPRSMIDPIHSTSLGP
jgi:hypothetical protein